MALATPKRITADEYFAFPDERRWTELIDGVVVVDSPMARHARIQAWLVYRFYVHMESHPGQGEGGLTQDVPMNQWNVFAPDLWWTADPLARDARRFDDPPELVIEVRSPSTWRYDLGVKKDRYEERGVAELWLIDTEADLVTVHRRSSPDSPTFDVSFSVGTGEVLTTPLIDGFEVDVSQLFDR
jgi:Uma2 family endonuclease